MLVLRLHAYCIVYFDDSMLARGSEEGVIRLMT